MKKFIKTQGFSPRQISNKFGFVLGCSNILLFFSLFAGFLLQGCLQDEYETDMVFVEGGAFLMGSDGEDADPDESPVHEVQVADFYMGRYEVTQAQWKAVMQNKNLSWFQGDELPVECVSWYDVELFLERLNAKTGHAYRLPTEAEWEYAARGGRYGTGCRYSGADKLDSVAWFAVTSDSTTHPVGSLPPNELGLYDMSGNVHEWCADSYDSLSYRYPEAPCSRNADDRRVFRGGSWHSDSQHCRIANRNHVSAEMRNYTLGFRLAEDADKEALQK